MWEHLLSAISYHDVQLETTHTSTIYIHNPHRHPSSLRCDLGEVLNKVAVDDLSLDWNFLHTKHTRGRWSVLWQSEFSSVYDDVAAPSHVDDVLVRHHAQLYIAQAKTGRMDGWMCVCVCRWMGLAAQQDTTLTAK